MTVLPELDARFEVLAKLGEGGMGTVYKVRHRDLDEVQIVKTMHAQFSANEALRERFINEARRGMKLRHPHIAGVHDFAVTADGTGYIVMEFVNGLNLRDLVAAKGPLRLPLVAAIAAQALDALGYLHSQKFVHRDISPDNLMLTQDANGEPFVKLIDLGIAKSLEHGQTMTATGQFIGKVSYASPEQFGGEIDHRSDLYSFGLVLYQLLTAQDAFAGDSYKELITAHLFQPPRRFEEVAPHVNVPADVQRAVYRALEKDPDKRYADAYEFAAALKDAFGGVQASGLPPTLVVTTPSALPPTQISAPEARTPRKRRWLAPVAATALILAAVLAFIWSRMESQRLAAFGTFHAVVIGESDYRKLEDLPSAVNDARAVAKLLEEKYGFDVVRLENASAQQIVAAIRESGKRMTDRDNLLVFYAGHGSIENGKGYWQGVDAELDMSNWISPTAIRDLLVDHPAQRTLILADSCYSGALARGALASAQNAEEKKARLVISSGGTAPVLDSADGTHSLFTRALLDVLRDADGRAIDVQALFPRIRERVADSARRAGREQSPELAVMAEVGDEGGSFYFVSAR
jgi:tRNA A-37 threonylcarbamoyl transferase component Bud32